MKTKFETPGQRQMWLDAIISIKVDPLPAEYASETWDDVASEDDATLSDEELEAISNEVTDEELEEAVINEAQGDELAKGQVKVETDLIIAKNQYGKTKTWMWDTKKETPRFKGKQDLWVKETSRAAKKWAKGLNEEALKEDADFTYDADLKSIKLVKDGYTVNGLYNTEYEDLFYKIWIEKDGAVVYQNDYGKEAFDAEIISDDTIDGFIDDLITRAMEVDPNLHESFQIVSEEETLEEDFSNINMLQGMKGKSITLKLKDGSSIDVASDEAKIIAKRYDELKGDLQKKFADLLNKSHQSFLIAYRDAYKD